MSYFPRTFMPLTQKANSPLSRVAAERMLADDYNKHDEEIRSIEEFLGALNIYPQLGVARPAPFSFFGNTTAKTNAGGMTERLNTIIEKINWFISCDGICSSSGYVPGVNNKALSINFPEQAFWTPLSKTPAPTDTSIQVESTSGFPSAGVITILNHVEQLIAGSRLEDAGLTTVEWIRYTGIEGNSFVNCSRGFLGTTIGSHAPSQLLVDCVVFNAPKDVKACSATVPGWGHSTWYKFAPLSLRGSFMYVKDFFQQNASVLSVSGTTTAANLFRQAGTELGLLMDRADGTSYLQSTDISAAAEGVLTGDEALAFTNEIIANGGMPQDEFTQPPTAQVMVFAGRMSVTHSICGIFPKEDTSASMRIVQTPSGQLLGLVDDTTVSAQTLASTIGCQAFFVPSSTVGAERMQR